MKKTYLLCVICVCLIVSCTKSIGNLDFEQQQELEFTKRISEIGTFNFKQEYSESIEKGKITTSLKITSTSQTSELINLEIQAFKSEIFSFDNLAFTYLDSLNLNETEFKVVDSEAGILLNEELILISIFNTSNPLSGHYEGIGKVLIKNNENDYDIDEIFNLSASININNRLYIFPRQNTVFDYLKGIYTNVGEFSGQIFKDSINIGSIQNLDSKPFLFDDNMKLNDTLNFSINNIEKQLVISLEKTK